MTEKQLFYAMRDISVDYILEAAPRERRLSRRLTVALVAAACAAVMIASAIFLPMLINRPELPEQPTEPPAESTEMPVESTDTPFDPEAPIVITSSLITANIASDSPLKGFTYWNGLYVSKALDHQFRLHELNNIDGIFIVVAYRNGDDITNYAKEDIGVFEDLGFAVREAAGKLHIISTFKPFAELSKKLDVSGYTFICPTRDELYEAFPQNYLPEDFELDTSSEGFECSKLAYNIEELFIVNYPKNDSEVYSLMLEMIEKYKSRVSTLEFWVFKHDGTAVDISELEEMNYIKYNATSYFLDGGVAILVKYEDINMQAIRDLSRREDISQIHIVPGGWMLGYRDEFIIN